MSEKRILTGSCNITSKAFKVLDELDITAENDDSPFAQSVRLSVERLLGDAARIEDAAELSCNRLIAAIENAII